MNEENTKLLESVRQHLEATGWRKDKGPFGNEIWFVRREDAPECQSNMGKSGILVIVTVSNINDQISFDIDITGQKENGVWSKLQSYAIGREFLDVLDVEVNRLTDAWKVVNGITPLTAPLIKSSQEIIDAINAMSHLEMCRLWRNSPPGHEYFDSLKPYYEVFKQRLFSHFGGFTPEISKAIGWKNENRRVAASGPLHQAMTRAGLISQSASSIPLTCEHEGCNATTGVKDFVRLSEDLKVDPEDFEPVSAETLDEWKDEPVALCPEHAGQHQEY